MGLGEILIGLGESGRVVSAAASEPETAAAEYKGSSVTRVLFAEGRVERGTNRFLRGV